VGPEAVKINSCLLKVPQIQSYKASAASLKDIATLTSMLMGAGLFIRINLFVFVLIESLISLPDTYHF
jgi:hypothetical protein